VTTTSLIIALLGTGLLCAHFGRTTVLLTLSYLALRRSVPDERKEILEALAPVLGAVGVEPRTHTLSTGQGPAWLRYTEVESNTLYLKIFTGEDDKSAVIAVADHVAQL